MNGIDEYESRYESLIEKKIVDNKDISVLRGYVGSISQNRTSATVYVYLTNVITFVRETDKKPGCLKYDDYVNYLYTLKKKTSSYQIVAYSSLKKFSEYLYRSGNSPENPMDGVEAPKSVETIKTKQKRENGYLTKKEIKLYMNNVKSGVAKTKRSYNFNQKWNERDIAIIVLLLNTGMRCSALYKLDVDSINFDNNSLVTIDKETKIEEHFFSDDVAEVLLSWIKKRDVLMDGSEETEALFISKDKKRLSQRGISRIVKKYSEGIEGKEISPHKLRATYGTQIYEKTHDLYMVQQCMGHSSPSTSELYIRGQKNEGRKNAANIMSNLTF